MIPEVKAGRLIHKCLHPVPPLTDVHPNFGVDYDESIHGIMLREHLDVSHLTPARQLELTNLIKEYCRVLCKEGVTTPIKDYEGEIEIDTGNARPIACHNPTFSSRELPIIKKAIAQLIELGHVKQIYDSAWLSKPLLAPKPHQENVTDIDNFV